MDDSSYYHDKESGDGKDVIPEKFQASDTILDGKEICPKMDAGVDVAELGGYPFILLPEVAYFGKMSRYCRKKSGVIPDVVCECTLSETARNLEKRKLGIAFLLDLFAMESEKEDGICFYEIAEMI